MSNPDHVGPTAGHTIVEDFRRFHEDNPHVYRRLVELARAWNERRGTAVGIKMLFEVLRWEVAMSSTGDEFKLNNNYHSYYARLIMDREPDLDGIFQLRRLHGPGLDDDEFEPIRGIEALLRLMGTYP